MLSKYAHALQLMAMAVLRALIYVYLFVERMKRISCWPWTNSWYVCIVACALFELEGVVGVCSTQYKVVISPSIMHHFAVQITLALGEQAVRSYCCVCAQI